MKMRQSYIDIVKVFAIMCLFFAHVQGPTWLENIRGFDVPLMVILSGILCASSHNKIVDNPIVYIKKRLKRLTIPSWVFLVIFYLCMYLAGQTPKVSDIMKSFLFQRDCGLAGGVWIIWVYVVCSLFTPILLKAVHYKLYWYLHVFCLIACEFLYIVYPEIIHVRILYYLLFTIIPYTFLLSYGIIYNQISWHKKMKVVLVVSLIHIGIGVSICFQKGAGYPLIQDYKYPAKIYYLTYGILLSTLLLESVKKISYKFSNCTLIEFISVHSLWIYLWQILVSAIINYVIKIQEYWMLSWIILLLSSVLITLIQNYVIMRISKRHPSDAWKYLMC